MGGSTEDTLIRTSTAGNQRGDVSASKFGPSIIVHMNEMSGRKGEIVKIFNEGSGRGSNYLAI
jgi:hypothetical protein